MHIQFQVLNLSLSLILHSNKDAFKNYKRFLAIYNIQYEKMYHEHKVVRISTWEYMFSFKAYWPKYCLEAYLLLLRRENLK